MKNRLRPTICGGFLTLCPKMLQADSVRNGVRSATRISARGE